jgi:hypothetical protein
MNSEQTDEDIFLKTILFNLLKYKFTQIFLMGQNSLSKTTDFFFEKSVDNLVKPAKFCVSNFFLFLTRLNFVSTEF